MSWKFVFNGNNFKSGTSFNKAASLAVEAEYDFLLFNGVVYFVSDEGFFETKITSEDLF